MGAPEPHEAPRRVLGLDPGTRVTGWGVVERAPAGRTAAGALTLVAYGTLRVPAEAPIAERLARIHRGILAVMAEHRPEAVGVEEAFGGRNVRSAIRLGEARGICMLAAELAGHPVHEVTPALVKKSVAGHGRAGKEAVREAVLRAVAWQGERLPAYDAADALAIAVCALTRLEAPPNLLGGLAVGRRRRGRRRWTLEEVERLGGGG